MSCPVRIKSPACQPYIDLRAAEELKSAGPPPARLRTAAHYMKLLNESGVNVAHGCTATLPACTCHGAHGQGREAAARARCLCGLRSRTRRLGAGHGAGHEKKGGHLSNMSATLRNVTAAGASACSICCAASTVKLWIWQGQPPSRRRQGCEAP